MIGCSIKYLLFVEVNDSLIVLQVLSIIISTQFLKIVSFQIFGHTVPDLKYLCLIVNIGSTKKGLTV